ncbi:MAG: prepilin-type N-terminal cleavage/methylation domain-containing protein [Zetaproteobacteria bacterium]|nr:prepilin-type N-terminal cleavage/methylation domain-containing protein [Zetaproteobacteria bacterium]
MHLRKEKGFTLIELMIVIAIIGILAAIAIPQFNSYRVKSYDAAAQSDLHNLQLAYESFYNDHAAYPAIGSTSGTASKSSGTVTLGDATAANDVSITLSNNVEVFSSAKGATYAIAAKHTASANVFTVTSAVTAAVKTTLATPATALTAPTAP